jgi:hypothetical protein
MFQYSSALLKGYENEDPNVAVAIHRSRSGFAIWCSMEPQRSGMKNMLRQENSIIFLKIAVYYYYYKKLHLKQLCFFLKQYFSSNNS